MFTRAGYNLRGAVRWTFLGLVRVHDGPPHWAHLVEFASGDLAWYSDTGRFLVWGVAIELICTRIWISVRLSEAPYSDVRRRKVISDWRDHHTE